jgi:hypothetical protein
MNGKEKPMAVRKVSGRGGNIIGQFPSVKMRRMVAFESTIERDYLYLVDYDPTVTILEEQPLTIPYTYEGKVYHYTPDFRVRQAEQERLVECKPAARVDEEENQRKFAAARAWCAEHRWEFQVVTDTEIRQGHRLKNVKHLTYYARFTVKPQLRRRIHDLLKDSPAPLSFVALAEALEPEPLAQAKAAVLHLVFFHKLTMPIDTAPITDATVVSLPKAK